MNFEDLVWVGLGFVVVLCLTIALIILIELP